jgi:hypothetical protein
MPFAVSIPNPLDLIPGPSDFLEGIFKWFLDQLGLTHKNALQSAMSVLNHVGDPNLAKQWYVDMVGNALGLSIAFAILAAIFSSLIVTVGRGGWRSLGVHLLDVFILFMSSVGFTLVAMILFSLGDGITDLSNTLAFVGSSHDHDKWWQTLLALPNVTDLLGNFTAHWIGTVIGWGMTFWAVVIAAGFYLSSVLVILAFPWRRSGTAGRRFFRWSVAGSLAIIFAKPAMMFFLAVGSRFISDADPITGVNMSLAVSLLFSGIAILAPLALFFGFNKAYIHAEGKLKTWSEGGKLSSLKNESNDKIMTDSAYRHTSNMGLRPVRGSETQLRPLRSVAAQEALRAAATKAKHHPHPVVKGGGHIADIYLKSRNGKR